MRIIGKNERIVAGRPACAPVGGEFFRDRHLGGIEEAGRAAEPADVVVLRQR